MRALIKVTISGVLIVYGFIGFAILSPLISMLSENPVLFAAGLEVTLMFALIAFVTSRFFTIDWKGIFSRLEDNEIAKTWLLLHSLFTFSISNVYPWVAVISSMTPLFLADYVSSFPMIFMSTWIILLFCLIGLWSLHLTIGMGYRWFCKGTELGIRSFSSSAIHHLRKKESKGIEYLLKALLSLKDLLKHEKLELQELDDTIKASTCIQEFESEIPYDLFQEVAQELKRFPSVENLPKALLTFTRSRNIQWTNRFSLAKKTKRPVLEILVVVASVLSGLTFLPETTRQALLEILQSVGSADNVQIILGFFLLVVNFYVSSLIGDYLLNPFDVKDLAFSEPQKTIK